MNELIKKYSDFYEGMSYSWIADKLLEETNTELSHRTLRAKISEYIKSKEVEECLCPTPEKCIKEDKCSIKHSTEEPIKYEANSWNKENTLDYFSKLDTPKMYQESNKYKSFRLQPYLDGNPNNVLVIPDTQFPFEREGALEHCRRVQEEYNCGTVIHIGDVKDSHASSFHTSDVDGLSAGDELDATIKRTREWHRVFPNVKVCLGNHDLIILRKAMAAGLSKRWIKGLAEVLETPTWEYDTEFIINGTMYTHTLGSNALNAALLRQVNLVVGHEHSKCEIKYAASLDKLFWSMNVGALVDDRKYAFAYAKTAPKKSVIACGVVIGNVPHLIPMSL